MKQRQNFVKQSPIQTLQIAFIHLMALIQLFKNTSNVKFDWCFRPLMHGVLDNEMSHHW